MRTKNLALPAAALGALLLAGGAAAKAAPRTQDAQDATRSAVSGVLSAASADRAAAQADAQVARAGERLASCMPEWPAYAALEKEYRDALALRARAAQEAASARSRASEPVPAAAPAAPQASPSYSPEELAYALDVGGLLALAGAGAALLAGGLGACSTRLRRLSVSSLDAASRGGARGERALKALFPHFKAAALGVAMTLAAVTAKTARFALVPAAIASGERPAKAEGRTSAPSAALEPVGRAPELPGDDYASLAAQAAAGFAPHNARWSEEARRAQESGESLPIPPADPLAEEFSKARKAAPAPVPVPEFEDFADALAALPDDGPAAVDQRKVETVRVAKAPDAAPSADLASAAMGFAALAAPVPARPDQNRVETVRVAKAPDATPGKPRGEVFTGVGEKAGEKISDFHKAVSRRAAAAWSAERKAYLEARSAAFPVEWDDALSAPVRPLVGQASTPRADFIRDALLTLRPGESLDMPTADGANVARAQDGSFSLRRTVRNARKFRVFATLGEAVDALAREYGAELDAVAASIVAKAPQALAPAVSVASAVASVSKGALRLLGLRPSAAPRAAEPRRAA